DPQLDALERQVTVSNQNLRVAEAQFRQARAALRYNRADYYPTVTAGLSGARTRVSAHRPPPNSIFNGITDNDFVLPVDVSYQADVWGRVRKNVESFREQAQASAADLATVNLSMHGDLALNYFQARSLDAQEQLLNSTVKQFEQLLELTQNRFEGGIASEVEVQQAKTQLQTTRAAAIDVGVLRAQFEHAVAILIGKPPVEDNLAAARILESEAKVQDEAVIAAQRSLDLSITRYKGGVTSYLEVLTAQSAALANEVTAVNILGRRMASTVLLIQALGGGWDRSSLPERPECCGKLASSKSNP